MSNIAREAFLTRRWQQELKRLANDTQAEKRMPLYLDEIYFIISKQGSVQAGLRTHDQ
jgi:hypothetical protein